MSIGEEYFDSILMNIQNILSFLPYSNYVTLKHVIYHLHLISSYSEINLMDSTNLAMVFAPSMFKLELQQLMDSKNYAIKSIVFLIDNYEKVFIRKDKSSNGSYMEPSEYQRPMGKCPESLLKNVNTSQHVEVESVKVDEQVEEHDEKVESVEVDENKQEEQVEQQEEQEENKQPEQPEEEQQEDK